jgi:hypothetical protein
LALDRALLALAGAAALAFGLAGSFGSADFTGFSRASMAVLSREICPAKRSA